MLRKPVIVLLTFMALWCSSVEVHAQTSNSEANRLFVEANKIFGSSKNLSPSDREAALRRVGSLLDQIVKEYPESKPAKAIAEGNAGAIILSVLPTAIEMVQSPSVAVSLAAASIKLDELEDASALGKLEHFLEILDFLLVAKDLEEARILANQILALPKWEKVLAPQTVKEVRETASNADVASKAALVCLVGTYILDAAIDQYVEPFVRAKLSSGFDSYLVSFLHETVDGACAAGPALLAGSAGTGGLLYPIAKGVEVLNELDSLNRANADLVDQAIDFAKLQIAALESVPTYDFRDLLDYKIAQDAVATDLMTGSGLNVGAGRRLLIVNAVMLIKARQIEGKEVNAELELLGQQVSEFDKIPGNKFYSWLKTASLGKEGLRDYAGFAAGVFEDLDVSREPNNIVISDAKSVDSQNYTAPNGYTWAQLASRRTVEEARAFASNIGEEARIFRTQNGWHAVTGALLFESESLPDIISDRGWPNDSLLTSGESFVEELPLDLAGSAPTPAFIHTKTLRATEVLWFSWDEGTRTIYDTRPLKQGADVVVWGSPDEEGYCLGGGGEGAVLKCADLVAFANVVESDGDKEKVSDDAKNQVTHFEPEPGTELRKSILDAIRPIAEQHFGPPVEFVVGTMRVLDGQAYIELTVQRPGGEQIEMAATPAAKRGEVDFGVGGADVLSGFLIEQAGEWKTRDVVIQATEAWWVGDCKGLSQLMPETCGESDQTPIAEEEAKPSSVQIAGLSCEHAASPVSRDTLLTWASKPISGRTASGADWSLDLWSLTTKQVGPAVFTNSKGKKTTGLWKPLEGKICQSYDSGASWECHAVFSCVGSDDDIHVMQNGDGQFTSVIKMHKNIQDMQDYVIESQINLGKEAASGPLSGKSQCDVLASSPYDIRNPEGILGVEFDGLSSSDALLAHCIETLERYPALKGRYSFLIARLHERRGNDSEFLHNLRKSQLSNYPISHYRMGQAYHNGSHGLKQNYQTAYHHYEKAISLNEPYAMVNMAWMYEKGQGRQVDLQKAVSLYTRADRIMQDNNSSSWAAEQLCRIYFETAETLKAKNVCARASKSSEASNKRFMALNQGYSYSIDACQTGGFSSGRKHQITVRVHSNEQLRLQAVEDKYARLSWKLLEEGCDQPGNRTAFIMRGDQMQILFSQGSTQPRRSGTWFFSRNDARTAYDGEQRRIEQQRQQELRRQEEARRQQAAREAATKKEAEIAEFQKEIERQWASRMEDMFSGRFVIENVGDLLQYNKAKAISLLSQGVTLQLATQNMAFQDGTVIITHEHDPTDVLKPVRDAARANMDTLAAWMDTTSNVGRDYSGPSINVVCRLSASALEQLDGKTTARFDAKMQSLNGRSAIFDCKLKR